MTCVITYVKWTSDLCGVLLSIYISARLYDKCNTSIFRVLKITLLPLDDVSHTDTVYDV